MSCGDLWNRVFSCDLCFDNGNCPYDGVTVSPYDGITIHPWDTSTSGLYWNPNQPQVTTVKTDTGWTYSLDVPGVAKEDVSIVPQCGTLQVSWERKGKQNQVTIVLEKGALIESISASLHDGVLEIKVPQAAADAPKKIKID